MPDFLVVKIEKEKDREGREGGEKRREGEGKLKTSPLAAFPLPAARARHINSNGKRIKPPHFLTRARSPLFSPNVKSFQRTFAEGDPLRYIVLNATVLARYTYVRNSSSRPTHRNFPDHVSSKASA